MSAEPNDVALLYQADRAERVGQPEHGTPAYRAMRARDKARRDQVARLLAEDKLQTAEDYYHAAWILNHGDTLEDAATAHRLALRSAELGYRPARWLAAASYDRALMYQGLPQKYGTQYVSDGRRQRLWDVTPETTDDERAAWDVPPLAEQLRKAEEATRLHPQQPPITDDAPQWLKDALARWGIPLAGVAMDRETIRVSIQAELEAARYAFHVALASLSDEDMHRPSSNPGWKNGEILFHMMFGFLLLLSLVPLVRLFGRLPQGVSRSFAALLNSVTAPFNWINGLGPRVGGRILTRQSLGNVYDWVYGRILRMLASIPEDEWDRGMYYLTQWEPLFHEYMTLEQVFRYPTIHFRFHLAQLSVKQGNTG